MFRSLWLILLAALLAIVSYQLTTLSQNAFFSYGVAFIGYSVASLMLVLAVLGKED